MKKLIVFLFVLYGFTLPAQENEIKKPEYVIVCNNEIISKEKLEEYGKQGDIKSVRKGVSKDTRDKLAKEFGDQVEDREFIILVDLLTEEEKQDRKQKAGSKNTHNKEKSGDELKLHVNDSAKDFTVQMIDGTEVTLSDLEGKVVLLNFWATWCAPCLMEFYEIPDKILKPFKNSDFVFLPVSRGETREKVEKKMLKLKRDGVDFNAGIDPQKKIWNKYATQSIPKNFLIDQDGIIRYISTGNSEGNVDKIAKEINKLLK